MSDIMSFHAIPKGFGRQNPEDIVTFVEGDEESCIWDISFSAGGITEITKHLVELRLEIQEIDSSDPEDEFGIYNQKVVVIDSSRFDDVIEQATRSAEGDEDEEVEALLEAFIESISEAISRDCDIAILWQ